MGTCGGRDQVGRVTTEVGPLLPRVAAGVWDQVGRMESMTLPTGDEELASDLPVSFMKKRKGNNPQLLYHEN